MLNHNYWRKLKEVSYGREKLVSYGLAINAHIDSLEILDIYYPCEALDNDSKDKVHDKASYCKMVVDKLHKFTNLKHLKFEVNQECSSVDVEDLDYIINYACTVAYLSLVHQYGQNSKDNWSYPFRTIHYQ